MPPPFSDAPFSHATLSARLAALGGDETTREIARRLGEDAARWAGLQRELKTKARAKFGPDADRMLFVREALEQASDPRCAAYRAARFPAGAEVMDLTAGIGADLLALARRGPARGIELDPERAAYAAHNAGVPVLCADALATPPAPYWTADPARRAGGRRLVAADDYAPPLSALVARAATARLAAIKLSPLLPDPVLEGPLLGASGGGLEFLSAGGECREAVLWLGPEAAPGRRAVLLTGADVHTLPASDPAREVAGVPAAYLFDADPAAVRAHALGAFEGLAPLGDAPGYLTGDLPLDTPWLRRYRVLAAAPLHAKDLRETLRRLNLRVFETKKRGVGEEPLAKLKALPKDGDSASLVLYAVGRSVRYALVRYEP